MSASNRALDLIDDYERACYDLYRGDDRGGWRQRKAYGELVDYISALENDRMAHLTAVGQCIEEDVWPGHSKFDAMVKVIEAARIIAGDSGNPQSTPAGARLRIAIAGFDAAGEKDG